MIVKDILNKGWECQCIGCAIGAGEFTPPGGLIVETKNFVLHQDPEVPIKGFLIIASKAHIKSISELSFEESRELFDLVYNARIALKNIVDIKEVNMIQEERSKHFHLWLLPRYNWMDEKFPYSLSAIREIMTFSKNNCKTDHHIKEILETVELIKNHCNAKEDNILVTRIQELMEG
jgi:diadenosine tetraphosphate (Ap4A) HIT family hydrolase